MKIKKVTVCCKVATLSLDDFIKIQKQVEDEVDGVSEAYTKFLNDKSIAHGNHMWIDFNILESWDKEYLLKLFGLKIHDILEEMNNRKNEAYKESFKTVDDMLGVNSDGKKI